MSFEGEERTMAEVIQDNTKFKSRNILNLDLDQPIFRVFPKERLFQALKNKQNTLVKPRLWDDPFENFLFNSLATNSNGDNINFSELREGYYGQCWTFNEDETDALWRIYSPNKDGFRVKTTPRKLFDSFYDLTNKHAITSFYMGKINYHTEEEIKQFFENPDNLTNVIRDTSGANQVSTLLIKRPEFKHENELRLILQLPTDDSWYDTSNNIYNYPIAPDNLFEEILADPRMNDICSNEYDDCKKEIRRLGYTNDVSQSTLYKLPNLNLTLNI
jgi:Protein of unknown function (DUF2971)